MPHPVQHVLGALRRSLLRRLWLRGAAWCAAALLAAALAAVLIDWLLRLQDAGLRIMLAALVVAAGMAALWRWLWRPLRRGVSQVDLALALEERCPELRGRLASAVEFLSLREDDPLAGSPQLRRAAVAQTAAALEEMQLASIVDSRPARRAVGLAVGMAAVWLLLALAAPGIMRIAAARLFQPLGGPAWPQRNALVFEQPQEPHARLARGADFEVRVAAAEGSVLPSQADLVLEDPDQTTQTLAMRRSGDRLVLRLNHVTRGFRYYVQGGDARTPPRSVEVVDPPMLRQLQVRLHPPAYTRWPAVAGEPRIRAVKGTRVELRGRTDKPLRRATVVVETGGRTQRHAAVLDEDGFGFGLPPDGGFVVAESGTYGLELEDHEGFLGETTVRYELRAESDLPPTVEIFEPAQNLFVTPQADVPLRIVAADDLGLAEVRLMASRSDRSDEGEFLVQQFEVPPIESRPLEKTAAADGRRHEQAVRYTWALAPLDLPPGTEVTFFAAAADALPQQATSPSRRLTIITPQELQDRLAARRAALVAELDRVARLQQEARLQTVAAEIQLQTVGRLESNDLNLLHGAELTQRQVARSVAGSSESLAAQVQGLLEEIRNNRLAADDSSGHLEGLLRALEGLHREPLPAVARSMTDAIKRAGALLDGSAAAVGDAELAARLHQATAGQGTVLAELQRLLAELSQWDNYRRFQWELQRLRRQQEDLAAATGELGQGTVTLSRQELSPQQLADLAKLATQQQELAGQFEGVAQRMERAGDDLAEHDPLAADAVRDALAEAQRRAIGATMRAAGRGIEDNQIGAVAAQQRHIAEALDEVLDILSNRREHELSRRVAKLRQAEARLEELRRQQRSLRQQARDARSLPDAQQRLQQLQRLGRQQEALREEIDRLARLVRRLQADDSAASLSRAAEQVQQAEQADQGGQAEAADRHAEQAGRDLDQAQQQLAQARRQAEMDLAVEQLARLQTAVAGLHQQQQIVVDETRRLAEVILNQEAPSRTALVELNELARREQYLSEEAQGLAEKLAAAEVFRAALESVAEQMGRAARLLGRREVGASAQRTVAAARDRLAQLLEALKPEQAGEEQPSGTGGGSSQPPDGIPALAELKLLKFMQEDLNRRTRQLQAALEKAESPDAALLEEFQALAEEQGRVADLAASLLQTEEPADDPTSIPELKNLPPLPPAQDSAPDGLDLDDLEPKSGLPNRPGGENNDE